MGKTHGDKKDKSPAVKATPRDTASTIEQDLQATNQVLKRLT
jgi:hypothetical protein